MEQWITAFLENKKKQRLLRSLTEVLPAGKGKIFVNGKKFVNLSSNDYLGLSSHPEIISSSQEALRIGAGVCASRLMTGSTSLHHTLEKRTAEFKKKPAALVFNSGYQANVGIISAFCGKDWCIFSDRLNHASIIDGIRLSDAKFFRFLHNDMEHLEKLLKRERNKYSGAFIITETVFSMDGDLSPLKDIVRLKEKYDCVFMVDEAHATGIFGKNGSGLAEEENVTEKIDIVMGTFSKALGSFGAYAAMSVELKEYFVNTCRSFIYSTALPPLVIAANLAALEIVKKEPVRRQTLLKNAEYLRTRLKSKGFVVKGESQIIPILTGRSDTAVSMSEFLKEKGYWALPIRPPTVPHGQARLRVSLSYDHDIEEIERFADVLNFNVGQNLISQKLLFGC